MKKDVKEAARFHGFAIRPPFSEMGMPAGCGKEASMVDEKKRRRRGTTSWSGTSSPKGKASTASPRLTSIPPSPTSTPTAGGRRATKGKSDCCRQSDNPWHERPAGDSQTHRAVALELANSAREGFPLGYIMANGGAFGQPWPIPTRREGGKQKAFSRVC